VLFDGMQPGELADALAGWEPTVGLPLGPLVELPVHYDGADLGDVARAWGMTEREAIAAHGAPTYVVAFCGFAPGFAYLAGLPAELAVPRLASPRTVVPTGSVAVADRWCGVYPTQSPGGWRLLGRTTVTLWDDARAEPALLEPGTRVRFVAAG
jgi:KipI family sensor histidine kinase inhibitor